MKPLIDWIYASSLSQLLQGTFWIVPVIQIVHILCLAVLFCSMLMLDARLIGLAGNQHSIESFASRFLPWMWWTLPVMLVSGALLVIAEPNRDLQNGVFYLKMSLLVTVCALTWYFQHVSQRGGADLWESTPGKRRQAKLIGLSSMVIWISIVFCGRLIAYV